MWKKLPYPKPFFLSFTQENDYFIYLTDYINIWWVNYTNNDFLNILKKSNDDLEMENDEQLLQMGRKMLLCPEDLKKLQLSFEGTTLNVTMTISNGFPVYLDMQLTEGSRQMFFERITQQLLKTVRDLKTSEDELRFLLIKKDKEIEEYKSETDVRLAMYLKTAIFSDEEHMRKHVMYEQNFGTSEMPESLLKTIIKKPEDQVIVKEEKHARLSKVKSEMEFQPAVKHEPESQVPENQNQNGLNVETVKNEIKSEPQHIPRKKLRKMLKI